MASVAQPEALVGGAGETGGEVGASPTAAVPARLDQLTSLRFFAALAVLSSHLWPLAELDNPLQPLAQTLFHEGYAGVSFFFMLSGFILAHTYQRKLASGAISRGKYLALRVARVGPLHWLVALPFVVIAFHDAGLGALPKVATNLLLLQAWVPDSTWYFSLVGPSWSLSDEIFFYTCFAFLAFLRPRTLLLIGVGLLVADVALVAALVTTGHGQTLGEDTPTASHWVTYILPATRLLDFIAGMLIYTVTFPKLPRWLATLGEVGALVLLVAAMLVFPAVGVPQAVLMQLAYLPFIALVILTFARGGGALADWLGRRGLLVLLGDASFALYLIHLPIIQRTFDLWDDMPEASRPPLLLTAAAVTLVCVLLSVAIYKWVETPMLRRSRRLIDGWFAR